MDEPLSCSLEPHEVPEGLYILLCDASFKGKIAGLSVDVVGGGKRRSVDFAKRKKGPIYSELSAVLKGLKEVKKAKSPVKEIHVYNDCLHGHHFIHNKWRAKKSYIVDTVTEIWALVDEFREAGVTVSFYHVKTKSVKRVDKRSKKLREKEELKMTAVIGDRVEKVEGMMARSHDLQVAEGSDGYYVLEPETGYPPGNHVTLDPLNCNCSWWQMRWAPKGEVVVKARALPCKHMCAVINHLELDVYDVFNRQVFRQN